MPTKTTGRKTTAKKAAAGKKRGRPSKQQKKQADVSRRWSILMFALGAVITAMSFVPGEKFWAYLRMNVLFGVFGFSGYLLGPVLIYIGYLTFAQKPVRLKMLWAFGFILLLSGFVQVFFVGDIAAENIPRIVKELHILGKEKMLSGGVIAGIVGLPLLRLFGAFAAKFCVALLLIVFFMVLTDTTPYDIYLRAREKAKEEKRELSKQLERQRQARAQRRQEREERRLARRREAEILERTRPRPTFNIDIPIDDEPVRPARPEEEELPKAAPEEETIAPVPREDFTTIFDEIKDKKAQQRSSVEEVMRRLNKTKAKEEDTPAFVLPDTDARPEQPKPEEKRENVEQEEEEEILPAAREEGEERPYIYRRPPISLFQRPVNKNYDGTDQELVNNAKKLVDTLSSFGVKTEIIDYSRGPAVTRYELRPLAGVKVSRITSLADDIALNLATSGVRIEAPIPGKAAVGIEVPNKKSSAVNIRGIFESEEFKNAQSPLTIALGEDISGRAVTTDLTRMPHLLIAGSTGSGKSVCVNSIIISFLYKSSPEDVKLILIDPKVVELAEYNGIPHLMMPVVTEPKKAAGALGGAVAEMEKRYKLFADNSVRDIKSFNKLAREKPELNLEKMPYVVVIIDELADLMMVAGKEVEDYICRLAQKARAAGIHLVVATQRPSVDVITGLIKANIPARIAFAVSSQVDSRTILDTSGAEKLLGMGDMLFLPLGANKAIRVQGTYVRDEEISAVIDFVKKDFTAEYNQEMIDNMEKFAAKEKGGAGSEDDGGEAKDEMLPKAVETVVEAGQASTSLLQRKLKLGYARAARIMDQMEEMGVVGPYEGSKPRQVLITKAQWQEMMLSQED